MKTTTIRELKHDTTTVLEWVAQGETVEVQRRGKVVAVLTLPKKTKRNRPDFGARLKRIYGDVVLAKTATALLAEERGER